MGTFIMEYTLQKESSSLLIDKLDNCSHTALDINVRTKATLYIFISSTLSSSVYIYVEKKT